MPVEQRSGSSQVTSIIIGVVAVVLCVAAAWGILRLASGGDGPVRVQLGDDTFDAGQVARIATQIAEEGPLLYSDVSGRGQRNPIVVNHFGEDPKVQWYVFTALPPDAPEGCYLWWNAQDELFDVRLPNTEDPRTAGELCNDDTYSATGESADGVALQQFEWRVDDEENLIVDLRD